MTRPRSSFDSYTDPSPSHQTHNHRSLSPLHLPHSSSSSKHTRRQDASRLLDPSYSSSAQPSTAVYIDHHGDAHDPDYRYFPAVTPLHKQKKNTAFWEDTVAVDDDDEEEQDMGFFDRRYGGASTHRRSSWGSGQQTTRDRGRRRHSGSFGTSTSSASPTSGRSMSLFSGYHYESPPTSFEEESTFAGEEFLAQKERSRGLKHLKRKRCKHPSSVSSTSPLDTSEEPISPVSVTASSSLPHSSFSQYHYTEEQPRSSSAPATTPAASAPLSVVPTGEWTPTCGQSLKRQWQALALRFRFGVFRAQRRVKRRVHSLL